MRRKDDDGRVVADMSALTRPEKKKKPHLDLTREEARQATIGALKAALLAGAVLCAVIVLLVLFMTQIWFR